MKVTAEDFSPELREEIRKWLNRFHVVDHNRFWIAVSDFADSNGALPKVNDMVWALLNQDRLLQFEDANLGLFSNSTASMCEVLASEQKWEQCFFHGALKSHLDLNGPMNCGSWDHFLWKPELGFLGSLVVSHLIAPANQLGWSIGKARSEYLNSVARHDEMLSGLDVPLSPEATWDRLLDLHGSSLGDRKCKVKTYRIKQPVLKLEATPC